jgi:ABC-2 type transport system ATP-binding protein
MLHHLMSTAISVRGLIKSYGPLEAVKGIDLEVSTGEVFALLGPNGAGKTTTVEILEGHRTRNGGEVAVLGFDPGRGERALKERIGIVLQETGVERFLTVEEVVDRYRGYYPRPLPLDEIIEVVGLQEKRKTLVRRLSGGQQRRLDVAVGLAGDPELLFLDEPTTGFDPSARRNAWQMVKNLKSLGKTIFLTTHYMDEAQNLADRVAIIAGGKVVAENTPAGLVASSGKDTAIRFRLADGATTPPSEVTAGAVVEEGTYLITTDEPMQTLHSLTGWALQAGVALEELHVARPSLEEVYLDLVEGAER